MIFTPRVSQILFLLLNSDRELTVNELTEHLHISRRTIYRELKDINKQLARYHVSLETVAGKGMTLQGDEVGKRILLDEIKASDAFDSRSKEHRLKKLTLEMLKQKDPKKLYYYAMVLQVAESTVSNDIEQLKSWFEEVDLSVVRRPGLGIYLKGTEQNYREACLRYMDENGEKDFLSRIRKHEKSSIYELFDRYTIEIIYEMLWKESILRKFTEKSFIRLLCYLSLSINRIIDGKVVKEVPVPEKLEIRDDLQDVLNEIEAHFQIQFSEKELAVLNIYYMGAKLQHANDHQEILENEQEVRGLVLEMLQCFDTDIRMRMKNDEDFLWALTVHLKPTLVRLRHNIKIENPFLDEVRDSYPDIYEKACVAAKLIEDKIGLSVPEEEIGMLAVHFGGALVRYEKILTNQRKVDIGVVCSVGIGISRLLASRLERIFTNEVNICVLAFDKLTEDTLNEIDFLVSTLNLSDIDKTAVEVEPMLSEQDIENIRKYIRIYSTQVKVVKKQETMVSGLREEVSAMVKLGKDIASILDSYQVYEISDKNTLSETMEYAAEILGKDQEESKAIYEAIMERERIMSQIVPEFELALLHGRVEGISHPRFVVIYPEGERFQDSSLKGSKVVMVMLIPKEDGENEVLGAISNAIFCHDEFLETLVEKDKEQVEKYLHFYLKEFLKKQLNDIL